MPKRQRIALARFLLLTLVGVSVVLSSSAAVAQPPTAGTREMRLVFPPVPRDIALKFARLQERAQQRNFGESAVLLAEILHELADQDYFLFEGESRRATSFRSEIVRVVSRLDPELAVRFQQVHGSTARRMLDEAVAAHNDEMLALCSHRWFLTEAGQQALLILARHDLDRDEPVIAIRRLSSAVGWPGSNRLEPERSVLLAVAFARAGRSEESAQVWDRLRRDHPGLTLRTGDEELRADDRDGAETLVTLSSKAPTQLARQTPDWQTHRGDLARSAQVPPLNLVVTPRWRVALPPPGDQAGDSPGARSGSEPSAATVLSPLCVSDMILARGVDHLYGVRVSDGQIVWRFPPDKIRLRSDLTEANGIAGAATESKLSWERLWLDATFGRPSSDGQRVFLIEQREPLEKQADTVPRPAGFLAVVVRSQRLLPQYRNQLVALDLSRQGAICWIAGGVFGGSEPQLAEATFLGPPLPVHDSLFTIAKFKERIELVCLSSQTGRKRWSLAIAQLDAESEAVDLVRHWTGTSPVYANGLLVCPTFAGAVVAVDLSTRQIAWAFQYRNETAANQVGNFPAGALPGGGIPGSRSPGANTPGKDLDLMAIDSNVLIGTDEEELICLDLETGIERWRRRRADTRFIAAIGDDRLLLVGDYRYTALRICDGQYVWHRAEFQAIPGGGSPSGRGVFDGTHFYLPTTDPELLQIDVSDGTIKHRYSVDRRLGNLLVHGHTLVSQTDSHLVAMSSAEPAVNSVPHARVDSQADVSALKPNHLVVMLGSRLFEDRERAAQELFRRKSTAISALADGMSSQIPEIAYRSASIVIRLLDEPDREVAAQARSVVLNVTDHRNPISAQALSLEYRWRSRAALAEIERFGGKIQRDGKSISLNTSWRGGADGLALFPWIANLEELELCHSAINDAALAQLRGLTHLKSLNLYRSSVTSNGIQHLTSWPNLETLMLQGTPTDDSAIKYLQQLSKLKAINLRDTRLSDLGIERVQQALPKLRILR